MTGAGLICGVDEAGRGPLAGPVCAAAVILDPGRPIAGLRDSKQLSAARRDRLAEAIRARALAWSVAWASVQEIQELNILQATLLAMRRAVTGLTVPPHEVLVDGNRCPADLPYPSRAIVQGDALEPAISAASILAKTERDGLMQRLAADYPEYGFEQHAGYPTPRHLEALQIYGPTPEHRLNFAPVKRALGKRKETIR